ncbi:MAG TPA: tetratricopeptide repeat protein [Isosphaeraceae bacterium]|jgi:tetratricopeptide (TPR) repeat protein|nr:tetratricopeptide repeat protein [Isosphaeraceae bacterium]
MKPPGSIGRRAAVVGLAVALGATGAVARGGDDSKGKRVITRYGTILKDGGKIVDDEGRGKALATGHDYRIFRVYRVERAEADRLLLVAENAAVHGWVRSHEVIAYDKAIDYFTSELRVRSAADCAPLYNARGNVYLDRKQFDEAIADFDAALRIDPKAAVVHNNRGVARAALKEFDRAIADYSEAIRLDPRYTVALNNRAAAYVASGRYDEAIADDSEIVRIDPHNAWGYNNRAWIWATCPESKYRDGRKALESSRRACELNRWQNPFNLGTLAAASAEVGDFAAAVRWQERALAVLPHTDPARRSRFEARLALYRRGQPYRETAPAAR